MSENTDIVFVLGTRPEIIKLAPIIRRCDRSGIPYSILHTGQHYSEDLNDVFFSQLELPQPDYNLAVGSGSHGDQTGEMISGIERVVLDESPEIVLVQGDTNSVLAGAIATSKTATRVGHVEAGLRSFNRNMPEEINRVTADHIGDLLFAPTEQSREYLRNEGINDDRIFVTGNTVVDAVRRHRQLAETESDVLDDLSINNSTYGLLTAHRAENVDDPERFKRIFEGVRRVAESFDLEFIYPIHPRARERVAEFGLTVPERVRLTDPQDYLDFLKLEGGAELVVTDSGGVQEETCILGVPCITVRDETERPETLQVGSNCLAGNDPEEIVECARQMLTSDPDWVNPFGQGDSADRILEVIVDQIDTVSALTEE